MKSIIFKVFRTNYVLKNDKCHSLYYYNMQEYKLHSKRQKGWQNNKAHNGYIKKDIITERYHFNDKEIWFNRTVIK